MSNKTGPIPEDFNNWINDNAESDPDDDVTLWRAGAVAAYRHLTQKKEPGVRWVKASETKWRKPTPDDRVHELVKAGALIAAEIDRLQNITK